MRQNRGDPHAPLSHLQAVQGFDPVRNHQHWRLEIGFRYPAPGWSLRERAHRMGLQVKKNGNVQRLGQ